MIINYWFYVVQLKIVREGVLCNVPAYYYSTLAASEQWATSEFWIMDTLPEHPRTSCNTKTTLLMDKEGLFQLQLQSEKTE